LLYGIITGGVLFIVIKVDTRLDENSNI
jgi:hypothetical protein